jgi:hypothetical protein
MEISAPAGKLQISAQTIEMKSSGQMNVQADATLTLKGTTVNIN